MTHDTQDIFYTALAQNSQAMGIAKHRRVHFNAAMLEVCAVASTDVCAVASMGVCVCAFMHTCMYGCVCEVVCVLVRVYSAT